MMPDMEKVIKGLERCQYSSKSHCDGCPYVYDGLCSTNDCTADLASDSFAMLKEQEEEIENLKQTAQSMMEGICLLKEQEAVKPILEQDSMVCGVCGHEVIWQKMLGDGIWADEELDYCPHCGRKVKWDE